MHDGNRLVRNPYFRILFGALCVTFLLSSSYLIGVGVGLGSAPYAGTSKSHQNQLSDDYCAGYKDQAKLHFEWLRSIEASLSASAKEDQKKPPDHPSYIECRDLAAQESMADATDWILGLAIAQLLLSVIGIGLLIWNAQLAREAVTATRDATRESKDVQIELASPYLVPEMVYVECKNGILHEIPKSIGKIIHYRCKIRNSGGSAAREVRVRISLGASPKAIKQSQASPLQPIEAGDVTEFLPTSAAIVIAGEDAKIDYKISKHSTISMRLDYFDCFGVRRFTEAILICSGKELVNKNHEALVFRRMHGEMRSGKVDGGSIGYDSLPPKQILDYTKWN